MFMRFFNPCRASEGWRTHHQRREIGWEARARLTAPVSSGQAALVRSKLSANEGGSTSTITRYDQDRQCTDQNPEDEIESGLHLALDLPIVPIAMRCQYRHENGEKYRAQ